MKTIPKFTVLAVMLGASSFTNAQTTETIPTPMEDTTADDDTGKWGLIGLLGLAGLLGLRNNRDDHRAGRGTSTH